MDILGGSTVLRDLYYSIATRGQRYGLWDFLNVNCKRIDIDWFFRWYSGTLDVLGCQAEAATISPSPLMP